MHKQRSVSNKTLGCGRTGRAWGWVGRGQGAGEGEGGGEGVVVHLEFADAVKERGGRLADLLGRVEERHADREQAALILRQVRQELVQPSAWRPIDDKRPRASVRKSAKLTMPASVCTYLEQLLLSVDAAFKVVVDGQDFTVRDVGSNAQACNQTVHIDVLDGTRLPKVLTVLRAFTPTIHSRRESRALAPALAPALAHARPHALAPALARALPPLPPSPLPQLPPSYPPVPSACLPAGS